MTWLVWRQHRHQAYFGAVAFVAFAVLLLITGLQMASQYRSALVACAASHTCGDLGASLTLSSPPMTFLVLLTMAVPILLGVFWGAPMVARETETGTSQFAWMQSVTRARWLAVKTGWVLLAAAAWGGAISALVTWWSSPVNALKNQNFRPGQFDIQGIVPVGYALFAVALGIAAGSLLRRSLPALAVTVGLFAGVRIAFAYFVRPHYLAALTATFRPGHPSGPSGSFWQLGDGFIAPDGQKFPGSGLTAFLGGNRTRIPSICRPGVGGLRGNLAARIASCLDAHGYHGFITYQPASRYWPFQGIETAIYVLLAAVLLAVTALAVLRRDA